MVDISSAISAASQLTSSASGSNSTTSKTLGNNFDTFLTLLTTQLQNQDPMNPMDTDQFTQQLIQYSEVEQLIQSNKNLDALVQLGSANTSATLVGYVGKEVTLDNTTTTLSNGKASWQLTVPEKASDVTIVVKDSSGNEVYSQSASLDVGTTAFSWDGTTSSGSQLTSGRYSINVTAADNDGQAVSVDTAVRGVVDGVDMTGDVPVLVINGVEYDLGDIKGVYTAS